MKGAVSDRGAMIAGMTPRLHPAPVAWTTVAALPFPADDPRLIALIREDEGLTLILPLADAETVQSGGMEVHLVAAQITLAVHSALEGVGLTAAVSAALAEAGIACNVVAGAFHDHLFVPWDDREAAMAALVKAAADARATDA